MMETRAIDIRLRGGEIVSGTLEIARAPPWRLVFSGAGLQHKEFAAPDLFEALSLLRLELEQLGAQVLCAGARPEVYPSGMSRDMGGGREAYVTRIGGPTRGGELLDIFGPADASMVGTVAEQQAFLDKRYAALQAILDSYKTPLPGEIEEARRHPGGWVYRIAGDFGPDAAVPPEAIIGAWQVDGDGNIVGEMHKNPAYDPSKWPAS